MKPLDVKSQIFSPRNVPSQTDRFFSRLLPRSKSKRSSGLLKASYIDTSQLNQQKFLRKSLQKSIDYKLYEISPRAKKSISTSRECLKQPQFTTKKVWKKNGDNFQFLLNDTFLKSKKIRYSRGGYFQLKSEGTQRKRSNELIRLLNREAIISSPSKQSIQLKIDMCKINPA
jgi:hypothetical protein